MRPFTQTAEHSDSSSITSWLSLIRGGEVDAARHLWERYFEKMKAVARKQLQVRQASEAFFDEEDVAVSAFRIFIESLARRKFSDELDRSDLWPLLVTFTQRRANKWADLVQRQKRGGGGAHQRQVDVDPNEIAGSPDQFCVQECQRLLELLGDQRLQQVALWRLEGHTIGEIAERLELSRWTVRNSLEMIRRLWESEL